MKYPSISYPVRSLPQALLAGLLSTGSFQGSAAQSDVPKRATFQNPVFWEDLGDGDILRVCDSITTLPPTCAIRRERLDKPLKNPYDAAERSWHVSRGALGDLRFTNMDAGVLNS